jgi:hypothetical protein
VKRAAPYLDPYISTQRVVEPLDGHCSASRPDIVIELVDTSGCDIIFIESKVGSKEGYEQLKRYAEILHVLPNFRHKFLLYITRDFDPKEEAVIFQKIPESTVQFKQLRWHQFHRFLQSQADTMLVQEMTVFMNEYNMAHNNQFSSIDVIALANFTKSLKLMEEAMWGEVSQQFKQVLGAVRNPATALRNLRWQGRYLMSVDMPGRWWCGLGFILKTSNLTDYPKVRLMLEVDPRSQSRTEIIKAMKEICQQGDWEPHNLNDSKAWSGIIREKSLQDFLAEEDHIVAIKEFFMQSLDELNTIKEQYPNLPWGAILDTEESSDDPSPPPNTSQP